MVETMLIIAPLFVILGVGIAAGFSRRFHDAQSSINAFVFYVSLPAFLFSAVSGAPISDGVPLAFVGVSLGATSVVFLLVFGLAVLHGRSSRGRGSSAPAGPLAVAATFGNVGYLGIPIALSVIGPGAALAAALGQLFHNVLFMVGYPLLKSAVGGRGRASERTARALLGVLWTVAKRAILLNPVALSIAAGVLVSLLAVELPRPVSASITMLGQAAVPTAMFAVGLTIKPAIDGLRSAGVSLTAVLAASVVKLAVLPLATLGAIMLVGTGLTPVWIAVAVIMAAMPVSSSASILVFEYDGDARLVAAATLVTSLASVLTIPLVIALLPL